MNRFNSLRLAAWCTAFVASSCSSGTETVTASASSTAPDVLAGRRLFAESRFAEFFAVNAGANLNAALPFGDPALDYIEIDGVQKPSPFAGQTFSCAVCHMLGQATSIGGGGVRAFADFAAHSPVTQRTDGITGTVRNTPSLVNVALPRSAPALFHLDGEFATLESLVTQTFEGRNYGWLADEQADAEAHIAAVVRADDGSGPLAAQFGGLAYSSLLLPGPDVPARYRIPVDDQLDVNRATDAEVVHAVAHLVAAYLKSLEFARDSADLYTGSPYDAFLAKNDLPRAPDPGEASSDYSARLLAQIDALTDPKFVTGGTFKTHNQPFRFEAVELQGLRVFLSASRQSFLGGAGNCAACHTPPDFTDFGFHNAGFSQDEYDSIHGHGAFLSLATPDLATRNLNAELYLPATPDNPLGTGPFRALVSAADPAQADLGLWNVFANVSFPTPQASILAQLDLTYGSGTSALSPDQLLPLTEGSFKTPGLRDLGHSGPYGHAGNFVSLEDVVNHYLIFGTSAAAGFVRNADPRLKSIDLVVDDVQPLAAFLKSLDEDIGE